MRGDRADSVLSRREEQAVQRKLCQSLTQGVRIGKECEDGCRQKGDRPEVVQAYSCPIHLQPHQLTPQKQSSQAPSRYDSFERPRIQTCDTQGHLRERDPHSLWVDMAKVKPKARPDLPVPVPQGVAWSRC